MPTLQVELSLLGCRVSLFTTLIFDICLQLKNATELKAWLAFLIHTNTDIILNNKKVKTVINKKCLIYTLTLIIRTCVKNISSISSYWIQGFRLTRESTLSRLNIKWIFIYRGLKKLTLQTSMLFKINV